MSDTPFQPFTPPGPMFGDTPAEPMQRPKRGPRKLKEGVVPNMPKVKKPRKVRANAIEPVDAPPSDLPDFELAMSFIVGFNDAEMRAFAAVTALMRPLHPKTRKEFVVRLARLCP